MRTACPGWSESSLGAKVILLVLSWGGSCITDTNLNYGCIASCLSEAIQISAKGEIWLIIPKWSVTWNTTKPTQSMCAQQRLGSAWASAHSDQSSLSAWRNYGSLATLKSAQPWLNRLDGCPGWSESSLGKQVICWFCHAVAHLV